MAPQPHEFCGARSKRTGKPCRAHPVEGKRRCYHHGGMSTGPRTPEGRERVRQASLRHRRFTKQAKAACVQYRRAMREIAARYVRLAQRLEEAPDGADSA
jgi:hypothetical protein